MRRAGDPGLFPKVLGVDTGLTAAIEAAERGRRVAVTEAHIRAAGALGP